MNIYKNLSGTSGVVEYEYGDDFIRVRFKEKSRAGNNIYTYTYQSSSPQDIESMKKLADAGFGLNSFINTRVRNKWASKQ